MCGEWNRGRENWDRRLKYVGILEDNTETAQWKIAGTYEMDPREHS